MASISNEIIPVHFNPEFFKRTLESGLRLTNIKILEIVVRNITRGGENYCSNIYQAAIHYKQNDDGAHNEIFLIIKSMPEQRQGVLSQLDIYCKETIFYLDIKPKMEALMWHLKGAWCLGAKHFDSITTPEQTIIFGDLCKQGFELKSRQDGLDKEHAILVMQKLAQYHALTMVIKEKEPEIIVKRYPFGLLNPYSIQAAPFKALFGAQLLKLASLVEDLAGFEEISKKLINYHDNFADRVFKSVYPLIGEVNVLNHGDLWVNNIFFKGHNSANGNEVRFIDFQLCYYGSPGFDINYFLNTSLQLEVLQNHRETLIEMYFKTLISSLEKLPYTQPPPTYQQILHEIEEREAYGFFVAFGFFPLMSMISLDSQDNSLEKFHDQEFARQKIELMFRSNKRTMETLKYTLKRLNDLGILD